MVIEWLLRALQAAGTSAPRQWIIHITDSDKFNTQYPAENNILRMITLEDTNTLPKNQQLSTCIDLVQVRKILRGLGGSALLPLLSQQNC
jgi:hypothetical protein